MYRSAPRGAARPVCLWLPGRNLCNPTVVQAGDFLKGDVVPSRTVIPAGPVETDMASCGRKLWRVFSGHQSLSSLPAFKNLPIRTLTAVRPVKKSRKEESAKEVKKEVKKGRSIDDAQRVKPFGKVAAAPVDDVFLLRFYPRSLHRPEDALRLLKTYQRLDYTSPDQQVYVDLQLDMRLEKKRRVDPFVGVVQFPAPFKEEENRVLVFTEDPLEVRVAKDNGAAVVGGAELIQPILDEEISADFFVAVPEILAKLVPLKNKLRKKFPKGTRGSVGVDIPKMLGVFKTGHQYQVEDDCYVRTQIATLNMTSDLILANLRTLLRDVCSRRPAALGPFIQRSLLCSSSSEGLWFQSADLLPVDKPEDEAERQSGRSHN